MEQIKVKHLAGSHKVGDAYKYRGKDYTIASIGKQWTQFIPDEDACVYGLMPGEDYRLPMYYLYLDEKK